MKFSKILLYGIIGLVVFQIFRDRNPSSETQNEQNSQQKSTQQQQQQQTNVDCSSFKGKKRTVQFDYSYIRKTHKEHLVRDYFDEKPCEWDVRDFNMNSKFDLVWVFSPHQIQYNKIIDGKHMVNHIQNLQKIVDKSMMVKSLQYYDKMSNKKLNSSQFLPKTYSLNLDNSKYTTQEADFIEDPEKGLWIVKPTNLFGGKGIRVIKDVDQFKKQVKQEKAKQSGSGGKVVIQKYIENPFLIEKKKFDLRCYVFIASTKPKYIALFHHGFIRRTLFEYKLDSNNEDDNYIHLTNVEAQKKHPKFDQMNEQLMMSMEEFESYFINQAGKTQEQLDKVYSQIKEISAYTVQAAQQQLTNKKGYFQVLGFDYMLDEDLNVSLIEINKSPSWQILNDKQKFKEKMLFRFIDTVFDIFENGEESALQIEEKLKDTDFEIIYNEYTNFVYQSND